VVPDRIQVGFFVDAGQVWERGDRLSKIAGVRVTPGVGLRFVTPLGPVRLDAAYNGYSDEAGPLYFQDNSQTPPTLTVYRSSFQPPRPSSLWRRIKLQFAVGQAF
jgi:outer membrane protein assembly factor BamA